MLKDFAWLELINESRTKDGLSIVSHDLFELAMDRFEKESFFQCEAAETAQKSSADDDALCSVCASGESDSDNSILFCDLCDIAVHQVALVTPVCGLVFISLVNL